VSNLTAFFLCGPSGQLQSAYVAVECTFSLKPAKAGIKADIILNARHGDVNKLGKKQLGPQ